MSVAVSIARRHVERLEADNPERLETLSADALSVCQEILDDPGVCGPEDLNVGFVATDEDTITVTLPSGRVYEVTVEDVEKMTRIDKPIEALIAILALIPAKIEGEGW